MFWGRPFFRKITTENRSEKRPEKKRNTSIIFVWNASHLPEDGGSFLPAAERTGLDDGPERQPPLWNPRSHPHRPRGPCHRGRGRQDLGAHHHPRERPVGAAAWVCVSRGVPWVRVQPGEPPGMLVRFHAPLRVAAPVLRLERGHQCHLR